MNSKSKGYEYDVVDVESRKMRWPSVSIKDELLWLMSRVGRIKYLRYFGILLIGLELDKKISGFFFFFSIWYFEFCLHSSKFNAPYALDYGHDGIVS